MAPLVLYPAITVYFIKLWPDMKIRPFYKSYKLLVASRSPAYISITLRVGLSRLK
ncbi:hypothetical protein SAMN05661012_05790 [Chitinophaga sancti]|uniref:Uncharacterized protein n=1 Tax=Chitinophaga sancti TaxID=1004 RepID=A0A1K1SNL0_9BACT|nr:hypothetical protein SAMN05661012_05790 [Chitinophaga sancti]